MVVGTPVVTLMHLGLNAPYGARCFLTAGSVTLRYVINLTVLMHLMALGAF